MEITESRMRTRIKAVLKYKDCDTNYPSVGETMRATITHYLNKRYGMKRNNDYPTSDAGIRRMLSECSRDQLTWVYNQLNSYIDYMLTHNDCPTCHRPLVL